VVLSVAWFDRTLWWRGIIYQIDVIVVIVVVVSRRDLPSADLDLVSLSEEMFPSTLPSFPL
jgi:hypothetical protein